MTVLSPLPVTPRKSMEPWIKDSVNYGWWQVLDIRKAARMRNVVLGHEMGLGKSLMALTIFAIDVVMGHATTMLISCPWTLRDNWKEEIPKHTGFSYVMLGEMPSVRNPGKTVTLTAKDREKQLVEFALRTDPRILVTNYEQLEPHVDQLNSLKLGFRVYDESHYLKGYNSKRTKAAHEVHATRTIPLTATPLLNTADELWSPLHMVAPLDYNIGKYWNFKQRFCVMGGHKGKQIVDTKNRALLKALLDKYMIRRLARNCLSMAEPNYEQIRVDMYPEQRTIYDMVVDDLMITDVDGVAHDINNPLVKFLRALQICGTTFPFTGEDISMKLDQVIIDATRLHKVGRKNVIFTQFVDVANCAANRAIAAGIPTYKITGPSMKREDRVPTVKHWAAKDEAGLLVIMLQIGREGLNMGASRDCMFVDKLFVPKLNEQAVGRFGGLRAAADAEPVTVREYITRKSYENRKEQILRTKTKTFDSVVETADMRKALSEMMMYGEDDD